MCLIILYNYVSPVIYAIEVANPQRGTHTCYGHVDEWERIDLSILPAPLPGAPLTTRTCV